jgi:chromosome segregation ATPase
MMSDKNDRAMIMKTESDIRVIAQRLDDYIGATNSKFHDLKIQLQNTNVSIAAVFDKYDRVMTESNERQKEFIEIVQELSAKTREAVTMARQSSSDSATARKDVYSKITELNKKEAELNEARKAFNTRVNWLIIAAIVSILINGIVVFK